jgi:uncharacterized membrane protein
MAKTVGRKLKERFQGAVGRKSRAKARTRPATLVAAVVFLLIAIAQLLRLVFHVKVVANGLVIPMWPSIVACVVAAALAIWLWRESRL